MEQQGFSFVWTAGLCFMICHDWEVDSGERQTIIWWMTWKLRLPGNKFTKSKDFLPHPQWEKLPMGPSAVSVEPPPFKWIADPPPQLYSHDPIGNCHFICDPTPWSVIGSVTGQDPGWVSRGPTLGFFIVDLSRKVHSLNIRFVAGNQRILMDII